jgi:hypothetical protein
MVQKAQLPMELYTGQGSARYDFFQALYNKSEEKTTLNTLLVHFSRCWNLSQSALCP